MLIFIGAAIIGGTISSFVPIYDVHGFHAGALALNFIGVIIWDIFYYAFLAEPIKKIKERRKQKKANKKSMIKSEYMEARIE